MAFLYKVLFNKTNDLEDTRDYEDEKDVEVKQEGKDKKIWWKTFFSFSWQVNVALFIYKQKS